MKTKISLLTMALLCVCTIWAQPGQVTWSKLGNPLTAGTLPLTGSGSMIWGDYNNDGWLDAFILSGQGADTEVVGLYKNNKNGTFTEVEMPDFFPGTRGSAVFIDYDNDGNLDLLATAGIMGMPMTLFFKNSGAPNYEFTEVVDVSNSFPQMSIEGNDDNPRTLHAFDYNNDGWMDLIINGATDEEWNGNVRIVALYKNNNGTFEYQSTPVDGIENFQATNGGAINVGDVNNDGYADIIISGYVDDDIKTTTSLYINNGDGSFSKWAHSQTTFTGHQQGDNFFIDVNNDGWLDIIEIGRDVANGWSNFSKMYINNKDLTFETIEGGDCGIPGGQAFTAIGDVNNDGKTDFFVSGWGPGSSVLYNNGDNTFTNVSLPSNEVSRGGFDNFVDFDNDNSLDLTLFGYSDAGGGWFHAFYKNDGGSGITSNNPPSAPTNVVVKRENDKYVLSWNKAEDDHTPQDAIRYNVSIDFKNGKKYAYVAADLATGKVKVNGPSPFIMTTSIELNLPEGDYSFGVQAIDQANVGSAFAIAAASSSINTIEMPNVVVSASKKAVEIQNGSSADVKFAVISMTGQIIDGGEAVSGTTSNVAMESGVYLVKLLQGNTVKTVKVSVF